MQSFSQKKQQVHELHSPVSCWTSHMNILETRFTAFETHDAWHICPDSTQKK